VELRAGAARAVAPAADPYAALPGVSTRLRVDGPADVLGDEPVITAAARPGDRDPFGRPRLVHTASGGAARLGWTAEGQRAWRIGPHGERESWRHDGEGRVVEHRDATGRTTRRTYGPFGLPIEEFDAAGARTAYGYDAELRLTAVTNPAGRTWRYTYDPAGRLVEETDFDGRRLTYAYDEAGQLRRMTNGLGEVTEYAYDALGNVVERRTATGVTGYAYDALGQLEYAINNESVLQIVRDERGRVREETLNGVGVRWTYDAAGVHRTTLSGVDSEWRYDGDLPASLRIAGHEIAFEYDEAGRETTRAVDGEVVLRRVFDAADRLGEQTIAGVGRRGYTYTPDGRLAAIDDARPVRFGFDQAGRVTEVHGPEVVERFAYDAAGRLTPPAGTRYRHDPQGRVTGRVRPTPAGPAEWRFVWDELDRLVAVIAPDESFWTYLYDPLGRRFAKRRWVLGEDGSPRQTAETWFVWSGGELVEEIELTGDGQSRVLTWERHPGDGRPVVQVEQRGAEVRFHTVVTSPAGTPTELLGPDGSVGWQARTGFWGELLPSTSGTAPMPLAFPGQYRDAETGLHYNVYRYYDPHTGRYLSQDPLGLAAAPDPVGYVAQPHLQSDPLGLVQSPCGKTGGPKAPENPAGGGDAAKLPPGAKKPDGLAEFRDPDGKVRPHNMTDEQYAKFSKKWDEMMKPGKDKSWFWSGGHIKDSVVDPATGNKISDSKYHGSIENPAIDMAKKNGGNTLEGLLKDNGVEMPKFSDNHPNGEKVWKDASKALAHNAEGDVHIALPNTPGKSSGWADQGDELGSRRPNNVFDMDEFPILRHNPKVDKVIAHDTDYPDAPPVVIWDRTTR
jgi:RHS repeat-associated protein